MTQSTGKADGLLQGEPEAGDLLAWLRAQGDRLPLSRALIRGAVVMQPVDQAMLLGCEDTQRMRRLHIGVFFRSTMTGCACADDPTPEPEFNEYAELEILIDRSDGTAQVRLLD